MANHEHLGLLKAGAVKWSEWREHNPQIKPDLSGANLEGDNLQRCKSSAIEFNQR